MYAKRKSGQKKRKKKGEKDERMEKRAVQKNHDSQNSTYYVHLVLSYRMGIIKMPRLWADMSYHDWIRGEW
jgi:hypothetical protein